MSRKWITWMVMAPALSALLAGCGGDPAAAGAKGAKGAEKKDKEGAAGPAREVRLAKAEEGRLARTVDVSGTLAADEQAELGFKIPGRLQQIMVDIGTPVRRGQVIARLTPTDYELRLRQSETALQQARTQLGLPPQGGDETVSPEQTALVRQAAATLKQAQLTRDRMAKLFDEQLIPQSDLDAAEAALGVADGRYQEAVETARTRQGLLAHQVGDGLGGYVVDGAPYAAAQLLRLLREPALAAEMGRHGRARIARDHLITGLVGDYLDLLHHVTAPAVARARR